MSFVDTKSSEVEWSGKNLSLSLRLWEKYVRTLYPVLANPNSNTLILNLRNLLKDVPLGCSYNKLSFALGCSHETYGQSSKICIHALIECQIHLIRHDYTYTAVVALGSLGTITADVAGVTARVAWLVTSAKVGVLASSLGAVAAKMTSLTTLEEKRREENNG
jgi:hypothetical protein